MATALEDLVESGNGEVTLWLRRVSAGDQNAHARLLELVYRELHRRAAAHMRRERSGHVLQATALVNEAYMKLIGRDDWKDRAHFMGAASEAMRCILIDHARARKSARRGGSRIHVELTDDLAVDLREPENLLALNSALDRLAQTDPRQARIVEMRFFAGMGEAEVAEALGISERTVKRDWAMARAWLRAELTERPRTHSAAQS